MSVHRKREKMRASEPREGLRKVKKLSTGPVQCPVCQITLRPETIAQHYEQELERLRAPPPPLRKRRKQSSEEESFIGSNLRRLLDSQPQGLIERAKNELDSVRRRQLLFEHRECTQSHDQPGPSHQSTLSVCPVCGVTLSSVEEEASIHVDSCLKDQEGGSVGSSSEDEQYEEYTWCNVTRVRATSMLSAEARANLFNGTVMSSAVDTSVDDDIDVETDDTGTYGPAQFNEGHIQDCIPAEDDVETKTETVANDNQVVSHVEESSKDFSSVFKASDTNVDNSLNLEEDKKPDKSLNLPLAEGSIHLLKPLQKEECSSIQCLICMSNYTEPVVSVQCWHVYCERCWLQALKAQKLCPKCKRITCASDLRRIFL